MLNDFNIKSSIIYFNARGIHVNIGLYNIGFVYKQKSVRRF